jgi:hypothetical protein
MAAITFTWANADFDRRHSTSEMGQQRRFAHATATSALTLEADIRLRRNI